MSEREEVQTLINRFMNSFDSKDWSVMSESLSEELEIDYSDFRGDPPSRIKSIEYVSARKKALEHLSTHHLISNFDTKINKDVAIINASCIIYRTNGTATFNSHVLYQFELNKIKSHWKISRIEQTILWNEGDPTIHPGAK